MPSPDLKTLRISQKWLEDFEKKKAKNGGKAPAHMEQQAARHREMVRRLS